MMNAVGLLVGGILAGMVIAFPPLGVPLFVLYVLAWVAVAVATRLSKHRERL